MHVFLAVEFSYTFVAAATRFGESLNPKFGHLKPHGSNLLLIFGSDTWLFPIPKISFPVGLDWLLDPKIMYLPVISLFINLAWSTWSSAPVESFTACGKRVA